jgi:hypothetical protein
MLVVGSEIPLPLQPFAKSVVDALDELQNPGAPFRFASVATVADLPSAETFALSGIIVADANALAISTLVGAVWTWLRADGSAL